MKPGVRDLAALGACALMAFLPACGSARPLYDPAPSYVTVREVDGRSRVVTAASVGLGQIEQHAGECADFGDGEAWVYAVLFVFYLIYYLGWGFYAACEYIADSIRDSQQDETTEDATDDG